MPRPGFATHPKFRRALRRLGITEALLTGLLVMLWEFGNSHGSRVGDAEDVEDAAGWIDSGGDDGRFAEVLLEVGYLDQGADGSLSIHDLYENAPDYVRKRRARQIANDAGLDYRNGPGRVRQAIELGRVTTWEDPDHEAIRHWDGKPATERRDSSPNSDAQRDSAPSGAEQRRAEPNGALLSSPLLSDPLHSSPEESESESSRRRSKDDRVDQVFDHHDRRLEEYRRSTGGRFSPHGRTLKLRKRILEELKARGGDDDAVARLRLAVDGIFRSKWHCERNALGLENVLRQVDRLADEAVNGSGCGTGVSSIGSSHRSTEQRLSTIDDRRRQAREAHEKGSLSGEELREWLAAYDRDEAEIREEARHAS